MRRPQRDARQRPRPLVTLVVATVAPLAMLVPVLAASTGSASASPSAGYTASLIPTGVEGYAAAVYPPTNTVYIADIAADELSVINGATNTVTGTIPLNARPLGVAVDTMTNTVYVSVTVGTAAALDVVDGATGTVTHIIGLPAGSFPVGVAVDSLTHVVYVADYDAAAVTVIDGSANTVTKTVSTGSDSHPREVAVDQASDVAWVADSAGNVVGISGTSNTVTQTISLGGANVAGVDVDPGTHTVYAAIESPPEVAVISAGTVTTINATEPVDSVAVDPGTGTVFATSFDGTTGSGTTWVIDESSNAITDTIQRGGLDVVVNPETSSAYVAAYTAQPREAWVLTRSSADAMSPVIQSTSANFTVGAAGSFTIAGSALPQASYTEVGTLPSGVTLSSSGTLSGTPAAGTAGSYLIELIASNGISPNYSQSFTLVVSAGVPPAITSVNQATFNVGIASSFTVTATGSPAPTFSESGTLPGGLTFSSAGVLSGTPAPGTVGNYPIQITATNAVGTATQAFTLIIDAAVPPAFTSADQATFQAGVTSSFSVTATGDPAPTLSETGTLPGGLTFGGNGLLSGTPGVNAAGVYPIQITANNVVGTATEAFTLIVEPQGGLYIPLSPVRVLDTRNGIGGTIGPVGPGGTVSVQVGGVDGVPSSATAVVLNVTVTDTTASSYLSVYPNGELVPSTSNLNFTAGQTISNLVVVTIGGGQAVDFYNNAGSADVVADLEGYYDTVDGTGSVFVPVSPSRLLDTRDGTGGTTEPVGPGGTISLQVTGADGLPLTGVTAVVLNVTATDTTASSYVTVYPDGSALPISSNLNFTPGETIPNLVTVPVGPDGQIDFYNHVGDVDLVADVAGYYTRGALGSVFVAGGPRILDTRNGTGGTTGPVGPSGTISLQITRTVFLPSTQVTAVVLNVTATDATASSYVTVYPDGETRPTASSLNFTPGETIPNLVVVPVGPDGMVDFYNHAGGTDLVADMEGYFTS